MQEDIAGEETLAVVVEDNGAGGHADQGAQGKGLQRHAGQAGAVTDEGKGEDRF